jgi:hypothetical protein
MKRLLYIPIVLVLVVFTGCEEYLEENNKSNYTTGTVYSTIEGIESLVNACYSPLRMWYGKEGGIAFTELGTDIGIRATGCTHPGIAAYHPTNFSATDPNSKIYWERFYAAVNYCNLALQYISESNLTTALKDRRTGEVSFLRAFYLWHIVETWGDVYLSLEPNTDPIMTATRTPVETFYTQIISDLDEAIKFLEPYSDNYGGRVNSWAAKAFKARMLLTRASASYTNNSNRAADYAAAATLAKEVINAPGNKFVLATDYVALWNMANSNGNTNKEVVWFVNYSANLTINPDISRYGTTNSFRSDGGNQAHLHWCMVYDGQAGMTRDVQNGRPFNRYMPALHYLQLFDASIDQRYEGTFKMAWYANNVNAAALAAYPDMKLGDTAIYITQGIATQEQRDRAAGRYRILDSYDFYENGHDRTVQTTQTPQMRKADDNMRAAMNDIPGRRDHFVIRIAEMYLIVAEAQMTANPAEAVSYMNTLRRARAISGKEAEMEISASDLNIDFILEERARELG